MLPLLRYSGPPAVLAGLHAMPHETTQLQSAIEAVAAAVRVVAAAKSATEAAVTQQLLRFRCTDAGPRTAMLPAQANHAGLTHRQAAAQLQQRHQRRAW